MITRVSLENWKSHLKTQLDFAKGTNVLVGISGSGKSLPYEEQVLTKMGNQWMKINIGEIVEKSLKKSKNIEIFDNKTILTRENPLKIKIQTLNPENFKMVEKKVSGFIKHLAPPQLLKIKTRLNREITITTDHSMLKIKDGDIYSARGSELKVGDFIPSPMKMDLKCSSDFIDFEEMLPEFRSTSKILSGLALIGQGHTRKYAASKSFVSSFTLANWHDRKITHSPNFIIAKHLSHAIPTKLPLSKELARICGAYISEGSVDYSETNSRYKVSISNTDEKFLETCENDWKKIFPRIPIRKSKKVLEANSKIISALFLKLFGKNAGDKKSPYFIYWFDKELLSDFLKMYFEGDGYVSHKPELSCSSKSFSLLDSIQTLLSTFGIISKIRKVKRKQGIYYELHVLIKHIPLFAKNISFLSDRKQKILLELSQKIETRKKWNSIDIIPDIEDLLKSLTREYSLRKRDNQKLRKLANKIYLYRTKTRMGRNSLIKILNEIGSVYNFKTPTFKKLENIANSDILFDEIKEIEKVDCNSDYVYDLAVEGTENFVAGKGNLLTHNSSVMDAICFSLFGTFPQANAKNVKLEEVIMSKPVQKNYSKITTEFAYNEKKFTVERTINQKGPNEAKLFQDGRLIAGPKTSEVTQRIEEILEVNFELFSRAVYTEQNQVDYFLKLSNAERKEKIDDLLMLKKYERVRSNAVSLQNRFRKELDLKKTWLKEQEKKGHEEQLVELVRKTEEKTQKKQDILGKKALVEKKITELEAGFGELEAKAREFNSLKEEKIRLEAKTEAKKRELERLSLDLEKLGDPAKVLEEIEERKKELEKKAIQAQKTIEALVEKSETQNSERLFLLEKTEKSKKYSHELEHATAACPVCRQKLDPQTKKNIQKESLEEQIQAIEKITGIEKEQKKTSEEMLGERKTAKECERQLLLASQREIEAKNALEKEKQRREAELELKGLLEKKTHAEKLVLAAVFDEKKLEELKEALLSARHEKNLLEKEASMSDELVREINERIKKINEALEETNLLRKDTKKLEEASEKTGLFISALRDAQTELRESLVGTINEAISDIWQKIYPYSDLANCMIKITEEGNYEIVVQEKNGSWKKVDATLSGGERSCAALAIRVAVSLVLTQNLGWLILDEPTHNLDKNIVKKLSAFLKTSLPELVDQVFIITHEKEMEQAASASLYFLEREKGDDAPSKTSMKEIIG